MRAIYLLFMLIALAFSEPLLVVKDQEQITNSKVAQMQKNKLPLSLSQGEFIEQNGTCYFFFTGHAADGMVNANIMLKESPIQFKKEDILHLKVSEDLENGLDYAIAKLPKCPDNIKKNETATVNEGDIVESKGIKFQVLKAGEILKLWPLDNIKAKTLSTSDSGTGVYKDGKLVGLLTTKLTAIQSGELLFNASNANFLQSLIKKKEQQTQIEPLQHIFSGWEGVCEHGTTFTNPFNDPMKILSYALMVWSAAGTQTTVDGNGNTVTEPGIFGKDVSEYVDSVENSFSNGADAIAAGGETAEGGGFGAIISQLNKWDKIYDLSKVSDVFAGSLRITDFLTLGAYVLTPTEENIVEADGYMKAWMGDPSTTEHSAVAYASCMASIGLSFPNVVSASIEEPYGASEQLKQPYENYLRMTDRQLQILAASTSVKYVEEAYRVVSNNGGVYNIASYDALAYTQAGQAICAGDLSLSMNVINEANTQSLAGETQGTGEKLALGIARMAVSKLMPPYNIIATVIFDIITSIGSMDSCGDMEDAAQWGHLKTYQHVNFDQCHHKGSECAAKWFWGSCMRDREKYCCYDMITTRIIAEGLKEQFCKNWDSCSDFSIEELKQMNFVPCKDGEDACTHKCFPQDKYKEFFNAMTKSASKDMDGDMQAIMNQIMGMMNQEGGICD